MKKKHANSNGQSNGFSDALKSFFQLESASGILLMAIAVIAIIAANTPLSTLYDDFNQLLVAVQIGTFQISKPLILWVNDGLMAIFFFLVGLELKREVIEGELSKPEQVVMPGIAAVGGMAIPAGIYVAFNYNDPQAINGWAIPAATDIAFALGILTLLGPKVPIQLKLFLTSLAIFDDIGAIIIIALFYTDKISVAALISAIICLTFLLFLNRRKTMTTSPYIFVGVILWVSLLKSGVHATLAGVLLAMFIPIKDIHHPDRSPLKELEHNLHGVVAFAILPIFAFANAGVALSGVTIDSLLHQVPLGIALGLFLGKPIGIFGFCWVAVKLKLAQLPKNMNWGSLFGVSFLCGIGFTMSLFIASLAFEQTGDNFLFQDKLGILMGSILSGIVGYLVLRQALNKEIN